VAEASETLKFHSNSSGSPPAQASFVWTGYFSDTNKTPHSSKKSLSGPPAAGRDEGCILQRFRRAGGRFEVLHPLRPAPDAKQYMLAMWYAIPGGLEVLR
jgi:hypothetical protein